MTRRKTGERTLLTVFGTGFLLLGTHSCLGGWPGNTGAALPGKEPTGRGAAKHRERTHRGKVLEKSGGCCFQHILPVKG